MAGHSHDRTADADAGKVCVKRGPKKKSQAGKGRRISVYLPATLATQIADSPGVNLSRVVREALTSHFNNMDGSVAEYGNALQQVGILEMQLHAIKEGLSSACRTLAKHSNLVVLEQDDQDKTTKHITAIERELLETQAAREELVARVGSLEAQVQESVAEAATLRQRQEFFGSNPEDASVEAAEEPRLSVDAAFPREGTCGKCEYLSFVDGCCSKVGSKFLNQERSPDDSRCEHYWESGQNPPEDDHFDRECSNCHVRFDSAESPDARCSSCRKPLCWGCFAGDTGVGEEPVGLCSDCLSEATPTQDESGGGSGSESEEEWCESGPESPPSPVETPPVVDSDEKSSNGGSTTDPATAPSS